MEIRWKLHCQVVVTHILTYALKVKEKEELKNLSKWSKLSFYVMVDYLHMVEIFTYLKNKKKLIIIVNKKFKIIYIYVYIYISSVKDQIIILISILL